jgi:DnaJ-class molecular chaperone
MPRDFYEVLGVRRDADQDAIKHAFRSQSRALHPDVSTDPDAPRRFQEVSEAYTVLSRPESRRLYDRFGWRGRGRGFERRRARVYASNRRGLLHDLELLLASAAGREPDREPPEVVASVELDAYEAHIGATRRLEVAAEEPCGTCDGTGRRWVVSNRDSGRFLSLVDCGDCGATGVGRAQESFELPVPPRVRDLDRLRVGPRQVAIVKIVPARDRPAVRAAAFAGLLLAVGFLLFLLSL